MDDELKALLQLLQATPEHPAGPPERRRYVANRAGVNPHNLYQVARGIRMASGRVRRLGRDVKEALTAAFPGWLNAGPQGEASSAAFRPLDPGASSSETWPHLRFPESYWQSLSIEERAIVEEAMLESYDRLMARREQLRNARTPPRKALKSAA